ncbi:hypothetical protein MMC30_003862 [Trapelia coarctata]|nr:hypothetical protein [Trapelia coarctata]
MRQAGQQGYEALGGPIMSPNFSKDTDEDGALAGCGWTARVVASHATISTLVDIYFEVVYPIFPFFHRPTLLRKVASGEYNRDRPLFAGVMATCALASARARDGALFSNRWRPAQYAEPPSEAFYAAARDAIPKDLGRAKTFDYLRACALLAIIGIQYGQIDVMHQYLGFFHTMVTMRELYDENNWDRGLGIVGIEERRRVFWSIYTLEVYSSIVWGGTIRCREAHSRVQYPTEVDDEFFSDEGFDTEGAKAFIASHPRLPLDPLGNNLSWLRGWNLTSDLYRILEHATDRFRTRRLESRRNIVSVTGLFGERMPPEVSVLDNVGAMVNSLPQAFKVFQPITMDNFVDRYSFQAANIAASVQLVRMLLFEPDTEVAQKCVAATELLESFLRIPIEYLRAISTPLLHHLAGIGSLLGSVIERPISEHLYQEVRQILLNMARLLSLLEEGLQQAADARGSPSACIKSHIDRIDNYMANHGNMQYNAPPQEMDQLKVDDGLNQQDLANANLQYQIPDELLQDWPWPLYATQNNYNDLLPLHFNWDYNAV